MAEIENSTFFDMTSYQLVSQALFNQLNTVSPSDETALISIFQGAFFASSTDATVTHVTDLGSSTSDTIVVGLTLDRAHLASNVLDGDWGTRQHALADQAQIRADYGTDPIVYQDTVDAITSLVGSSALIPNVLGGVKTGYVSTAESRTIWLSLTADEFNTLFQTPLLKVEVDQGGTSSSFYAWAGNLSVDSSIQAHLDGLWVQQGDYAIGPAPSDTGSVALDPSQPVLGPGNGGARDGGAKVPIAPNDLTEAYNFPLGSDSTLLTSTIALVEGNVADPAQLFASINTYREQLGFAAYTASQFAVIYNSVYGAAGGDPDEIALDISVIAGAAPNSSQVLYSNNGDTYFTSYQQAIFDKDASGASIISSSYPEDIRFTPDSPFKRAYYELFVDAQLRKMSVFLSSGDGGSQSEYATGAPLVRNTHGIPNAVIVGGTSLSDAGSAQHDPTLDGTYQAALAQDPATLFALTAAGLTALPQNLSSTGFQTFTEAVWNEYYIRNAGTGSHQNASLEMDPDYTGNEAGTGGIDTTWDLPDYQWAFGIDLGGAGRGSPDVAALAGGNSGYLSLNPDYVPGNPLDELTITSGGTSAATPFWASLTAQLNAIFRNQGLPELGYFNDLLYQAAAIAPGSFNDITLGNNVSSYYYYDGTLPLPDGNNVIYAGDTGDYIVATGQGFYAQAGYDLTTGLGSPNGVLLARALSTIAHQQYDGAVETRVVEAVSAVGATSEAAQTLLVQASGDLGAFELDAGGHSFSGVADANALAWTSRLAGQVLQQDFDPALVRLLDGAGHGAAGTLNVGLGDHISASMGGTALGLYQTALTSAFGFAAFGGLDAGVTVARPVAVAQTVDHADDATAVVRIRQNGQDDVSVTFYKVDDLSGAINGIAPGQAGYAALADAHAYHTDQGSTSVDGPGWGEYSQMLLTGIDSGDLIAMKLTNGGNTYWAFANANEEVGGEHVTHLWSYGANTWGWEDLYGGGDHDYNDLVVQLDFTSTAGSGLLVNV